MARTIYGPEVIVVRHPETNEYGPTPGPLTVWSAITGGSQVTNLQTVDGTAISQLTLNAGLDVDGRVVFQGPDNTTTLLWVEDPAGSRWAMRPAVSTTVGPQGDPGPKGDPGDPGASVKGDKGDKGDPGANGTLTFPVYATQAAAQAGLAANQFADGAFIWIDAP